MKDKTPFKYRYTLGDFCLFAAAFAVIAASLVMVYMALRTY